MSSLRKVQRFLLAEQALDETFEFLPPQHRQGSKPFPCRLGLDSGKSEGRVPILMTRKPVPQAHDQRADQFVRRIDRLELGQLAAPQALYHLDRRYPHSRRGNVAEEPGAHLMEWHGAPVTKSARTSSSVAVGGTAGLAIVF